MQIARHPLSERATPAEPVAFLNSPAFSALGLPFSEIVRVGDMLYLSGQVGNQPGTLTLVPGGIEAEARQTLQNIKTSLEAHGYSMTQIVKCTVMLADMADWPVFNAVYARFFAQPYPARSAFAARGLALGGRLELEVIACAGHKSIPVPDIPDSDREGDIP